MKKQKPEPEIPKRPTITELEELLDDNQPIEILPNGEVRVVTRHKGGRGKKKPLTLREDLGGEYAEVA